MYATNESDGRLGGDMLALNTGAVRDLTDSEKAQCRRVWDEERRRLQPEMNRKKRRWLAKQGKKLIEPDWEGQFSLIRTTKDAITALKYQIYSPTPLNAHEPKKILNFQNGELHFLPDGIIKFRDHDPSSQLTSPNISPIKRQDPY